MCCSVCFHRTSCISKLRQALTLTPPCQDVNTDGYYCVCHEVHRGKDMNVDLCAPHDHMNKEVARKFWRIL